LCHPKLLLRKEKKTLQFSAVSLHINYCLFTAPPAAAAPPPLLPPTVSRQGGVVGSSRGWGDTENPQTIASVFLLEQVKDIRIIIVGFFKLFSFYKGIYMLKT
jgi:hypothetical protein